MKNCVACKGPANLFKDALSVKEYKISGLCQKCQDFVFDEEDEEEDLDELTGWPKSFGPDKNDLEGPTPF